MQLAEESLPKINSAESGEEGTFGGLSFCPLENTLESIMPCFAGKQLIVSDESSYGRLAPFARGARAISVVFEEDVLPLFAMPDGVSGVFAAGGERTLRAARFFAEVRRVPCVLFPTNSSLRGAYERTGDITLCGKKTRSALKEGEVKLDLSLFSATLTEGFTELLLSRLALIEERALRIFLRGEKPEHYESAFMLLEPFTQLTAAEIVRRNALLRQLERDGLPQGEGRTLARLHAQAGERAAGWRAYGELLALYTAFFSCGKPRKYRVPDYSARADSANAKYWRVVVPSPEEYARRSALLERMRLLFSAELNTLVARKDRFLTAYRSLGGENPSDSGLARLKTLPEHCPEGLTALIRDFGLMEF